MIHARVTSSGGLRFESSVSGIAVYLDNWSIKGLAKGKPEVRERFVAAVHGGADLLFSAAHAIEALGPQGASSDAFKDFLNQLGAHWYPVMTDFFDVLERENRGLTGSQCSFDEELLRAYFQSNTPAHPSGSGNLIDLSESFFRLGNFIDWLAPQRDRLRATSAEFDRTVKDYVTKLRAKFKTSPAWLDSALPPVSFSESRPANFAWVHLMRGLVTDSGYQIKDGDATDLGHAVIATAFSNFATLDKQWKRRVDGLPRPNRRPRVYYEPEIELMVSDIENGLVHLKELEQNAAGI